MNDDMLKLKNQLCFRLYKTSRQVIRFYQPLLESMNITYPQYVTMLVMWEHETIDFKELGQKLDLKTGTLTPMVKRLEDLGYVSREKNHDDNRKIWVKITKKGREQKQRARKIPETLFASMNIEMSDFSRFIGMLDELADVLTEAEN